ncbi:MAG TPA: nitrogenase component 1 [Patescibacteria group bacterium]|nr:nitrogenase component 1 [Patescibacteria group bacterium]
MCKDRWEDVNYRVDTCALTGAAAFFAGIPDAVLVANGPLWCYFYALRHLEKTFSDMGRRYYCTQTDGQAVIHGTEGLLRETLEAVRTQYSPAVMLVENSCAIGLIGDDTGGIVREAQLSWPTICLDTGGLAGGFGEGYRAAAKAYFARLPLTKSRVVEPGSVNLLGCTAAYFNGRNDIQELKRLLTLAGYRVLACPGAGSRVEDIAGMAAAELNIVVHRELGGELAELLWNQQGIPYIAPGIPYGLDGSQAWLESIRERVIPRESSGNQLNRELSDLRCHLQAVSLELQLLWGEIHFSQTLVAGPFSAATGIARALQEEWADTGALTVVVRESLPCGDMSILTGDLLDGSADGAIVTERLSRLGGGLLMGSSNEKMLLLRRGITEVAYRHISLPVHDEALIGDGPFVGLRGAAVVQEQLWNRYIDLCQGRGISSK